MQQLTRESSPLLDDYIFKSTFTKEGHEDLLKDFLEGILNEKIINLRILNPEINKTYIEEKSSILDIRAEFNDGNIVDIEMQVKNEYNIKERSTTYMSKDIVSQLKKNEDYIKLKKSIVIFILNFNLYERNGYHHIAHMKFDNTNPNEYVNMGYTNEEEIATSKLEMHFIELPKFIAKNPGVEGKLEQWLWLICGREDKLQMAEQENEEVKKAADLVEEMLSDPQVRELYDARLMAKWNYATGMAGAKEAGFEEGHKEGLIEVAKKLKNLNMPDKEICEITGLTQEELNNI